MIKYTWSNRNRHTCRECIRKLHLQDDKVFLRSLQTTSSFLVGSVNCDDFFFRLLRRKISDHPKEIGWNRWSVRVAQFNFVTVSLFELFVCSWSIYRRKMYGTLEVLRSVIGDNYRALFNRAKVAFVIVLMDNPLDSVVINVIFTCVLYMRTEYCNHRYDQDLY